MLALTLVLLTDFLSLGSLGRARVILSKLTGEHSIYRELG